MATVRYEIRSPRAGFTGEGAGQLYFRDGVAELAVDLDNWEPGNARGALFHFLTQGFDIRPLDGVSVDQALRDPAQEASALLAERAELQRQIDAIDAQGDVDKLRQQLADKRAAAAEASKAESGAGQGVEEGVKAPLRTDVVPPSPDAPVADWRAFAVEVDSGLDDKGAKALDKPTLVATYGGAYAPQDGTVKA